MLVLRPQLSSSDPDSDMAISRLRVAHSDTFMLRLRQLHSDPNQTHAHTQTITLRPKFRLPHSDPVSDMPMVSIYSGKMASGLFAEALEEGGRIM